MTTNTIYRVTGRLCYVSNIFEKGTLGNDPNEQPARRVGLLVPKDWAQENVPFQNFSKGLVDAVIARFGEKAVKKLANGRSKIGVHNACLKDGDQQADWMAGHYLVLAKNAWDDNPPVIRDEEGEDIESDPERQLVFPGKNATVFLSLYTYPSKKNAGSGGSEGINAQFVGLRLRAGGERVESANSGPRNDVLMDAQDGVDAIPPAVALAAPVEDEGDAGAEI